MRLPFLFIFIFLFLYIKQLYLQGSKNLIKIAKFHVIIQLLGLLLLILSSAGGAESAAGTAEPEAAETAIALPADTWASFPTP